MKHSVMKHGVMKEHLGDGPAGFPGDWLVDAAAPASDVELALLLVNSMDLLEDPPDRLVTCAGSRTSSPASGTATWPASCRPATCRGSGGCATPCARCSRRTTTARPPRSSTRCCEKAEGDPVGYVRARWARPRSRGCRPAGHCRARGAPARRRRRLRRRARDQAARGLRERPVQVRLRRPDTRRDAQVLLQLLQRPVRRPRLPQTEEVLIAGITSRAFRTHRNSAEVEA